MSNRVRSHSVRNQLLLEKLDPQNLKKTCVFLCFFFDFLRIDLSTRNWGPWASAHGCQEPGTKGQGPETRGHGPGPLAQGSRTMKHETMGQDPRVSGATDQGTMGPWAWATGVRGQGPGARTRVQGPGVNDQEPGHHGTRQAGLGPGADLSPWGPGGPMGQRTIGQGPIKQEPWTMGP